MEIYYGRLDAQREIVEPATVPMSLVSSEPSGSHRYRGVIPCDRSGMLGYALRVRPCHADANNILCTGLMTWR